MGHRRNDVAEGRPGDADGVATASSGYLRLPRENYGDADLAARADCIG
jgi:hypothetical protein